MNQINNLRARVVELRKEEPKMRNRDLAEKLKISELELLTLDIGDTVVRLNTQFQDLLQDIESMGRVMILTRNDSVVHEKKGVFKNLKFSVGSANIGVALNPDIDLRLFMNAWKYGLAVTMNRPHGGVLYSFQFFNAQGEAVHKIFTTPESNVAAYFKLVQSYKSQSQESIFIDESIRNSNPTIERTNLEGFAIEDFQQSWRNLQDTHDFHSMLKSHKIDRLTALSIAPDGMAIKISNLAVQHMCELAVEQQTSIMCFVHSSGCVQIHTGPIKNLKVLGTWFNILDPGFNLHLKMENVAETWVVKKPTKDGIVTSIELYDKQAQLITYFFGARKPGVPELEEWRAIVKKVIELSHK